MPQRPNGGLSWRRLWQVAPGQGGGIQAGDEPTGSGLHIPFHSGNLPRKQHGRVPPALPRGTQGSGPVDVGVPVDHPEPHELRLRQPGDQPEHARLLAPFELRLKSDQTEMVAGERVLSQLHDGIRPTPGPGIHESNRFHGTETQRVLTATSHHLDRQASFEETLAINLMDRRQFRPYECLVETVILVGRHRAIQVVTLALRGDRASHAGAFVVHLDGRAVASPP